MQSILLWNEYLCIEKIHTKSKRDLIFRLALNRKSDLMMHKAINLEEIIDSTINKPARYIGHEIGIK